MKNKTFLLIVMAVLLFNIFAFNTSFGLGVAIFFAVFALILMVFFTNNTLASPNKKKLTAFLTIAAVVLILLTSITANDFISDLYRCFYFVTLYLMILLNGLQFYEHNLLWWLGQSVMALPSLFLLKKKEEMTSNSNDVEIVNHQQKIKTKVWQSFVTLLVVIVVLVVFGALLSAADPLFSNLINHLLASLLERLFFSALLVGSILIVSVFNYQPKSHDTSLSRQLSSTMTLAVVSSLLVLFTLFLFTQLQYLFASEAVFAKLNITYADYVRQGFIQLLWVGALGFIVTYFVHHKQINEQTPSTKLALKITNLILVGELFAILLSAANRNWLYVSAYGLSRIRWVGMIFLVWLFLVFCLHFLAILSKKISNKHFFFGFFLSGYLALVLLGVIKMDRQIVNYNLTQAKTTPDFYYLSLLSEEVIDVWYQQLPGISSEIEEISRRVDLGIETEEDLKRLAKIKVALFKIDNNLNQLIIKYGSLPSAQKAACIIEYGYSYYNKDHFLECLLRVDGLRDKKLAEKLIETQLKDDYYQDDNKNQDNQNQIQSNDDLSILNLTDDKVASLLDEYQEDRVWQATNLAEKKAHRYYLSLDGGCPSQFFSLYEKIKRVQYRRDISLGTQVNWTESVYSSPLINRKADYGLAENEGFFDDQ